MQTMPKKLKNGNILSVTNGDSQIAYNNGTIIAGPFVINYVDGGEFTKFKNWTATGYSNAEGSGEGVSLSILGDPTPKSGEPFYVTLSAPGADSGITHVTITGEFEYMVASGMECRMQGKYATATLVPWGRAHEDGLEPGEEDEAGEDGAVPYYQYSCTRYYRWNLADEPATEGDQDLIKAWGWRDYYTIQFSLTASGTPSSPDEPTPETPKDTTMKLGGYVWEDVLEGKENLADGRKTENDLVIPNIQVTLFEQGGKKVSTTFTNSDGYYEFSGLNIQKKYYVEFEYNGLVYMPTYYLKTETGQTYKSVQDMVGAELYNTDAWADASKATETTEERRALDDMLGEIGSSPNSYKSSSGYNEAYSILDLMGYDLQANGTYVQSGPQLLDGFYKIDENGNVLITKEITEGEVTQTAKEGNIDLDAAIESLKTKYSGNTEVLKKLQFIKDTMIKATTKPQNGSIDLYPVYKNFVVDTNVDPVPGVGTFQPIYDGQLHVNLGLWRRQTNNIALRKDLYKAATAINGKAEVYKYNKRKDTEDYWNISLRMQDYTNYYGSHYDRQLTEADYMSSGTNGIGKNLEIYVTYQITVRNSSEGIVNEITEIVDYYDKELEYMENLSWVATDGATGVSEEAYHEMIRKLSTNGIAGAGKINSSTSSKYGDETKSDVTNKYNAIYIRGLEGRKLQTGKDAYIYLTFKVRTDDNGQVILDDNENGLKHNIAEINGYKNYYKDGTVLPNYDEAIAGDSTFSGIVDENSRPGNLSLSDLNGDKYEKNFEDDTDRSKGLKVSLNDTIREINGTVWEDKRTVKNNQTGDALIGNGIYDANEQGVENITVGLYEVIDGKVSDTPAKVFDGGTWKDATLSTGANGNYKIQGYVPGDYIVRFTYPNGNDYKSTVYQAGMAQPGTDTRQDDGEGKHIPGYTNYETQNESATYGYNIALGETSGRVSDAKDIWSIRQKVDSYGNNNGNGVTYSTNAKDLVNANNPNIEMQAETGVIRMEVEYNKELSDSTEKSAYNLKNLDFGIVERPKAGLKLDKKVSNLRVELADHTVKIDASEKADHVGWTPKGDALYGGYIEATVDEEFMYGANIQITYEFKAENTGEIDYTDTQFYYTGKEPDKNKNIVKTTPDVLVDYVSNNVQFRLEDNTEGKWQINSNKDIDVSSEVAEKLKNYNTIITTDALKQGLIPGETSKTIKLVVTQLVTTSKGDEFQNIAEILTYSNDVGRRLQTQNDPGEPGSPIIPGNQDPEEEPTEQDSSSAEGIRVGPPYGRPMTYVGVIITILAILIVAIIIIKKKILRN